MAYVVLHRLLNCELHPESDHELDACVRRLNRLNHRGGMVSFSLFPSTAQENTKDTCRSHAARETEPSRQHPNKAYGALSGSLQHVVLQGLNPLVMSPLFQLLHARMPDLNRPVQPQWNPKMSINVSSPYAARVGTRLGACTARQQGQHARTALLLRGQANRTCPKPASSLSEPANTGTALGIVSASPDLLRCPLAA